MISSLLESALPQSSSEKPIKRKDVRYVTHIANGTKLSIYVACASQLPLRTTQHITWAPQLAPSFNAPSQPTYVGTQAPQTVYALGVAPPMQFQPEGPPADSSPGPPIVGGAIGPNPAFTT
ncbi:hypothetical protein RvY_18547 [Ramazzottius varieornatus]|uniref:Uncharacterized protein n=1 Tax=Ramazzottius varieornatus TaxID=947166 RepID=A0A1D1W9F0_RAMVA|nr:hypothetical protein RvY_18547 [Ramazzottius varieornatus]